MTTPDDRLTPVEPLDWTALSVDPDEVQFLSQRLADWVHWLVVRYRLHRRIPPCWWRHGVYVEELSALWMAWRGVMELPDRPDAWCWWHDHLGRMLHRMEELWPTGCSEDHTEPALVVWDTPDSSWPGVDVTAVKPTTPSPTQEVGQS